MFVDAIKWVRFYDSLEALRERVPLNGVAIFRINNKPVCIGHSTEGLFAIRDKCPHQGQSFHGGWCTEDNRVVCPVHRYTFDLKTGRGHGSAAEPYPLEMREDGLYIGFPYMAFRPFRRKSGETP